MKKCLQDLTDESFLVAGVSMGTIGAVTNFFFRDPRVAALGDAIDSGGVSETEIHDFCCELLRKHFVAGARFPFDLTLAGIAYVLRDRSTPFAKDYLASFAEIRPEIMWTSMVASKAP